MRQPWNVFVYLYRIREKEVEYLLLKRSDDGVWQGIAGGGEDSETPFTAARREMLEETGAIPKGSFVKLDTMSYMEKTLFSDNEKWDKEIYVIPMYYFACEFQGEIRLSNEHTDYGWYNYEDAMEKLFWHDNKTALWELNERLNK
jgi:dATP pyrophosphohydrolase